jgi:hypothetical protein
MSGWRDHRVVTFKGSYDSHKHSGKEHKTTTLREIFSMTAGCLAKEKAVAIIPSSYSASDARSHEAQRARGSFVAIGVDIDSGNHDLNLIDGIISDFFGHEVARFVYSTSSADAGARKWRVIVPFESPLPFQHWRLLSEAAHAFMSERGVTCDPALARAGQLVFLPNVPPERRDKEGVPLFFASLATDGTGATMNGGAAPEWLLRLQQKRERDEAQARAVRPPRRLDVGIRGDAITSFNKANPLASILEEFGYEQSPYNDSDWRSPYQKSRSYGTRIFIDNNGCERWVSLSASDASAGIGAAAKSGVRFGDAFDLITHYQYSGDQQSARQALPPNTSRYKLMTAEEIAALPPIKWLVRGILPAEGLAAIYGASGSGKSFLALDLLATVARGEPWFDHKTAPCPVTYVALEGEAGLSQRVRAYEARHGALPVKVRFVAQPLNLLTVQDITDLASAVGAAGGGGGAICIDTLNRASTGSDENDSKDMGRIIDAAKQLQQSVGGLVLLVHHSGKDASKGLRGHSSLHAALDAAIEVTKTEHQRSWRTTKSKDGRDDKAACFKLETIVLGSDHEGQVIDSCVVVPDHDGLPMAKPLSPSARLAIEAYRNGARKYLPNGDPASPTLTTEVWRQEFYLLSSADTVETKKRAFHRARQDLRDKGILSGDNYSNKLHLTETNFMNHPASFTTNLSCGQFTMEQRGQVGTSPG